MKLFIEILINIDLGDRHDDVLQKRNSLSQECHLLLNVLCSLKHQDHSSIFVFVCFLFLPALRTPPSVLCVSTLGEDLQSRKASGLPGFCSFPENYFPVCDCQAADLLGGSLGLEGNLVHLDVDRLHSLLVLQLHVLPQG